MNRLIYHILDLPTPARAEDITQAYYRAYQQALDTASLYRLGLYLLSTVIIIWIAVSIIYKLRQSAIALQQSESKLRTIFENSQVGIFRSRLEDGLILDANQRFITMIGYDSAEEVVGLKQTLEFYVDRTEWLELLERVHAQQEVHNFETQFRRRDGSIFWVLSSARVNPEQVYLLVVITDISDRKRTEAALEQAKEAAVVANRAKSQFLSHMSHELRTPLSVILGFTQLLSRSSSLDPKRQEYLDTISRSGEHLLNLINDVLEMSKIEANKITLNEQDFNLYDLLDGLQQMFQFKATSKGLQFIIERLPDLPQYIRTDESKLRQVLFNLVGNAVKFTQAGSVTLRVKLETKDWGLGIRKEISQSPILNTQSLIFEVEDTGSGIASEELDQLFEPFVQTETGRRSQEGTGLGLPISRKFVQLMGGNITVESQLGKGSCFRFNIQAQSIEADVIPLSATSQQVIGVAAGQPTYRIMVVEDKPSNRQLLVELLKPVGFEVQEAENGIEAIALTQHWFPHLIWMDLQMPVMDGYQATKRIKSSEKAPIIIALTGNAFEQEQQVALEAGCDDFVRKPYRAEVIFEKMTQYLGVSYVYAEQERTPQENENSPSSVILSPSSLEVMSPVWIKQMNQAATRVNAKLLHQLIDQIPGSHAPIANALTHLIDNFQFEDLVTLTQQKSP
ncbi:response regulator [Brasilonema sp. CT11]|nr:response regulator [Brasilonema sp. CT11]